MKVGEEVVKENAVVAYRRGSPRSLSGNRTPVQILGVNIHPVTMEQTLQSLESFALGSDTHQIATVNPEFVMLAQIHRDFHDALNNASLCVPDGIGIVLGARLLGYDVPERVAGIDILERFSSVASRRGFRIFLLGAQPGVAERAATLLTQKYPGLIVAGTYAGSPRREEEDEICRRIRNSAPHILFVAYSTPLQDVWIARNQSRVGVPVAMGVGGSLDFVAGVQHRAPLWVRRVGLEWLFRLVNQPSRWRRMLTLPRFAFAVIAARIGLIQTSNTSLASPRQPGPQFDNRDVRAS
jgi:N-acetylglucosaminyldiphosphoundecaprenol N-acetyl-beta-D-mannosaminyltransferase